MTRYDVRKDKCNVVSKTKMENKNLESWIYYFTHTHTQFIIKYVFTERTVLLTYL